MGRPSSLLLLLAAAAWTCASAKAPVLGNRIRNAMFSAKNRVRLMRARAVLCFV